MFERFNGNVVPFADESTSTNRTVFGSETQSDDIDDNLNADFKKGWEIVGLNDNPTREDFNAMGYTLGYLTSYLYQNGVAEYNLLQEYKTNSIAIGADGNIYQSLVDNNIGNALTDTTKWVCIASKNSIVNSIAELKTISNIESINVLGYYEKGDGGGGTFYWDSTSTETDNGGTIIQATGITTGRWKRVISGAVNVKWFGAKGDGVINDDTSSIQAAIDYCYSVRVVYDTKTVYLDNGTYLISSTLNIPSYITLVGDGHNSILKVKDNSNAFNVLSITQAGANNINIRDFSIHGNSSNNANLINALYIAPSTSPCIYSVFQNLYIKEMSGSALFLTNEGADRVRFIDCMFRDSVKNNVYSTHLRYASFDNCIIRTSKTGFSGLLLDGVSNTDITIDNCLIEENALYGVYVSRANAISIRNSTVSYSGSTGIVIDRTNKLSLTDTLVHDNTGYGILAQGTSTAKLYDGIIDSCSIYSNNLHGLYLDYCEGASIHNNNFIDNSDAYPNVNSGIYLQRSSLNSIMFNTFNGVSQKYAIDWDSATAKSNIIHKNNIISVGTDYINPSKHDSSNYIHLTRIASSLVPPSTGSWNIGDIVYNRSPSASGFIGWVCTAAGTPGTWKTFGAISV